MIVFFPLIYEPKNLLRFCGFASGGVPSRLIRAPDEFKDRVLCIIVFFSLKEVGKRLFKICVHTITPIKNARLEAAHEKHEARCATQL